MYIKLNETQLECLYKLRKLIPNLSNLNYCVKDGEIDLKFYINGGAYDSSDIEEDIQYLYNNWTKSFIIKRKYWNMARFSCDNNYDNKDIEKMKEIAKIICPGAINFMVACKEDEPTQIFIEDINGVLNLEHEFENVCDNSILFNLKSDSFISVFMDGKILIVDRKDLVW